MADCAQTPDEARVFGARLGDLLKAGNESFTSELASIYGPSGVQDCRQRFASLTNVLNEMKLHDPDDVTIGLTSMPSTRLGHVTGTYLKADGSVEAYDLNYSNVVATRTLELLRDTSKTTLDADQYVAAHLNPTATDQQKFKAFFDSSARMEGQPFNATIDASNTVHVSRRMQAQNQF